MVLRPHKWSGLLLLQRRGASGGLPLLAKQEPENGFLGVDRVVRKCQCLLVKKLRGEKEDILNKKIRNFP